MWDMAKNIIISRVTAEARQKRGVGFKRPGRGTLKTQVFPVSVSRPSLYLRRLRCTVYTVRTAHIIFIHSCKSH